MSQYAVRDPGAIIEILTQAASPPTLREVTRAYAEAVVAACRGNKSLAAKQLGVNRRTLYRVLAGQAINLTRAA